MFRVYNYNLYVAREKERWKLVCRTGRSLIGERNFTIGGAKWSRLTAIEGNRESKRELWGARWTKKSHRPPSIFEIMILSSPPTPYINIQSPLASAAAATAVAAAAVRSRVSFFSLFYTLFRFSLFCGLRRFALQLIISPLSYPLSRRKFLLSHSLLLSSLYPSVCTHSPRSALSLALLPLLYAAIYGHYAGPRYTTQSAVMPAIKLN